MLQELIGGGLIGRPDVAVAALDDAQRARVAAIAAGYAGLLSLFNIAGRLIWASFSDKIGRKATYYTFFALGFVLYASIPGTAHAGSLALFVAFFCIILSMYGGGFATIPAYLADMFGTRFVGAIHGRLLTAWAAAGIFGPVLVNYLREYQLDHGVARADAYTITMYILSGLLILGFICNWLVREVDEVHHMTPEQHAEEKKIADDMHEHFIKDAGAVAHEVSHNWKVALAWLAVGIPLAWGIWMTAQKALVLFK
jgi:MFS family permease